MPSVPRFAVRRCAVNPLLYSGWAVQRNYFLASSVCQQVLRTACESPYSRIPTPGGNGARSPRPVSLGGFGHPPGRLPPARPSHPHGPPAPGGRRPPRLPARGDRPRVPACHEGGVVRRRPALPGRRGRPGDAARPAPGLGRPERAARGRHRLRRCRLREARRRSAAAARRGPRPRQLPPGRGPVPDRVRGRGRRRLLGHRGRAALPGRQALPSAPRTRPRSRGAGPTRSSSPYSRPSRTTAGTVRTC